MSTLVFVYGTLKAGFPNFHINTGTRVPGNFVTAAPLPLYIATEHHIPWLVNRPGQGQVVRGQLYAVDEATLARMDVLERINEPEQWYTRATLVVRPADDPGAAPQAVQVYFGSAARLAQGPVHEGPLAEYTLAHARRYRDEDDAPQID